ncbi:SDR family NAD(P)-dependent oxidoreductase [bacterium]|nr:SDR family NAD(P)-dependent oxidoreductase [candidate division CSSED10-310 bacterium]
MKVLVTGGAGFIGSHIVDACLESSAEKVIALDNFVNGQEKNLSHLRHHPRFVKISGDIRDVDTVRPLVHEADVIFNEAASKLVVSRVRPRIDLETNILGTFNILEAMKETDKILVHASTGSVLGNTDEAAMREDHPQNPSTLYGISKGAAEKYVRFYSDEFNVRAAIIRYFHVYGPRQEYGGEAGVVSIFLGRVLQGKAPVIFGTGEQIRCFTYVRDDVAANFMLLEGLLDGRYRGEVFNCAARTRMSVLGLAEMIIEKYGPQGMKPMFGPARLGENLRPIPDTRKIETIGFRESVSFEEGLDTTCHWVENDLAVLS